MYEVFSLSRLFVMAVFHCGLVSLSPSLQLVLSTPTQAATTTRSQVTLYTLHLIVILASNVT